MNRKTKISRVVCYNLLGCQKMLVGKKAKEILTKKIEEAGFQTMGAIIKFFPGGGYTYVCIIGESSVDIHTWPENNLAQIKIHYCNFKQNNDNKANKLIKNLPKIFAGKLKKVSDFYF